MNKLNNIGYSCLIILVDLEKKRDFDNKMFKVYSYKGIIVYQIESKLKCFYMFVLY